jgi:hypothetical protein
VSEPLYSFDTSSFLNGRRDLLPPEVFTTLWANVEAMITNGRVRSIDVVRDELGRRDDAVADWAKGHRELFVSLDSDIQQATRTVLAQHPKLMGKGGGRNAADPFVIGLALARRSIVVTEEALSGNLSRPRIPDVCDALGVRWLNLVGFVREQGWTF